jgi:hypothetical protein
MNLYLLHTDPESLDHHDKAHDRVPELIKHKYSNNTEELRKREAAFTKDAEHAFWYAERILKGRFKAGEEAIAKSAGSYYYAAQVLKSPFYAGEEAIAKDAECSLKYAKNILKDRFPAAEDTIAKTPYWPLYKKLFNIP